MGFRRLSIMRKDLHMSAGKLAAQVGHCAEAYWTRLIRENMVQSDAGYISTFTIPQNMCEQYLLGSFVKTICEARNKNHHWHLVPAIG